MDARRFVCLLSLLAPCASASVSSGEGTRPPNRYAVLIGINDYQDDRIPDLKCAEADAKALHKVLTDPKIGVFPPGNVTLILGKDATPTNIKKALNGLRTVGKNDLVIVFYSGHGAKELGEAFWVTQQAELGDLTATALGNRDVRYFLERIPSQRLVTLLDCCYAAATVKDRKSIADTSDLWTKFSGTGRVVIAGASETEEALEMPDVGLGVFTNFLVRGLAGKADGNGDGVVTLAEAYAYLSSSVEREAIKRKGFQKATLDGNISGQLWLTVIPSVREADKGRLKTLNDMRLAGRIEGKYYDEARRLLSGGIVPPAEAKVRQVYVDLADGKIDAKYLADVLSKARQPTTDTSPVKPSGKPTLAIVDFRVSPDLKMPNLGKDLPGLLTRHFEEDYTLIVRGELQKLLDEDALTMTDLVEGKRRPTKALKLRRVEYLVIGSIFKLATTTVVNAHLVRWETGRIERSASVSAPDLGELEKKMPQLAAMLLGQKVQPVGAEDLLRRARDLVEQF